MATGEKVKVNMLVGRVVSKDTEVIVLFRVNGKYYASTGYNRVLFESYLHTGDRSFLEALEDELEVS